MPLRAKTTKGKIHEQAKHLMRNPKFSAREAHGVATGIVTGQKPKKKGRKMPHGKKTRKRYGYGGSSHMDRGLSYANAPQGYRSDEGKPMGDYGKPYNGYVDHSGMPNAGRMRRMMEYMSGYYGGGNGGNGAGNPGYHSETSSTNYNTSPNPGSMDSTYKTGQATIPKNEKQRSGR